MSDAGIIGRRAIGGRDEKYVSREVKAKCSCAGYLPHGQIVLVELTVEISRRMRQVSLAIAEEAEGKIGSPEGDRG